MRQQSCRPLDLAGRLFQRAIEHHTAGRLPEAEALYQAIRLRPSVAEYHGNLGNALRRLGRSQEAIANYRRALQRRPDFAEMHYNLGNTLRDLG
jgi:tetratricopeptide (TPR) repeat protein